MTDISGLSETDASNTSITSISIAEQCPAANINDAIRAILGALKRDWDKKGPTVTSAGNDTITLSLTTAPASYVRGEVIAFVAGGTNTGAATMNVNSLGAKTINKGKTGATALAAGDITSGGIYVLHYDGTNFQLINPGTTGSGTVTSVGITQPAAGITSAGGPITSTGSITLALANDLSALEGLSSTGIAVRTASDTWAQRTITAGTGIGVTNGNGVSGNPTIAEDTTAAVAYTGSRNFTEATLTDAAPTTWNLQTQQNAKWTIGAARTLSNPTNMVAGLTANLRIIQDGTGGRVITWSSAYLFPGGTKPTLSTAVGAIDLLSCVSDGTSMYCVLNKAFA